MRVAHFVHRYRPALGGAEDYFARLSDYLAAAGDEVTVFTTNAVDLEYFSTPRGRHLRPSEGRQDGVTVRRYGLLHVPFQQAVLKILSFVPHSGWQTFAMPWNPLSWQMWRDAGRHPGPFDLVHATAFPYGWPLACAHRLARRLRVPLLLTPFLHLGDPGNPRDKMRRAFLSPALLRLARAADRLFVQTEGERQALQDQGIPSNRLVLQGMGVDLASCTGGHRDKMREQWGCRPEDIVVGHLANNSYEKGTIDLLRAADRAWRAGERFHLVLAGPEMPAFRRFWPTYQLRGPVRRLGVLDEQAKRDFFAAIDVFTLPSRSDSFGIVLLEAWANGKPNIVYRAGGLPWVVRHEEDGLVVNCADESRLALAIVRLVRDADLRWKLGESGRLRLSEFHWDDKLTLVRREYENVASRVP